LTATGHGPAEQGAPRSAFLLVAFAIAACAVFAGFVALGNWQIERRAWKHALIARVEQRVHAPAVAAPGPAEWPQVNAARDEYRHVRVAGTFLHDREALVQAATALGAGYWVLTPLRTADGATLLVNRGFVPPERRQRARRDDGEPSGEIAVTGLLRMTEPGGAFLRRNDAAADRWYSRDVQAIAASRGLTGVAPYFVDADAAPRRRGGSEDEAAPVGGLTVIAFNDNHLAYAITWYALALMVVFAARHVLCVERRLRRGRGD
jgi:surfeit locus 1 family protein